MRVFFLSIGLFTLAFAIHVAWWRVRRPYRQTRAIVLIFFGIPVLVFLGAEAWGGLAFLAPESAAGWALVFLCVGSLVSAYIITYSALEAESPTLVMVQEILAAGPSGVPRETFVRAMNDSVLVIPRIRDLLRDRMAREEGGRLVLTAKGAAMAGLFKFYRGLLRAPMGG